MVSSITTPLERQFGQISGLASMNSTSSYGTSTITLQFVLDRPDRRCGAGRASRDQCRRRISTAKSAEPAEIQQGQSGRHADPNAVDYVDSLPLDRVNDFADTLLAPDNLAKSPASALSRFREIKNRLCACRWNPAAISALGLSLEDVRTILGQANVNAPKGSFDGPRQSFTIGSNDQIFSADAYKPIIVAYKNGAPIRLGDVANIIDSVENDQLAAWVGTQGGEQPAVAARYSASTSANIIQTVDRVKQLLPRLTGTLPPSVHVPFWLIAPRRSARQCATCNSRCY